MRVVKWLSTAGISVGLAAAVSAQDAPTSGAEVFEYLHGLAPAERLEVLEREARREGQLVIYGALGIDVFDQWKAYFAERYPDIPVEFVRLQGGEVPERALLEHRTGRVNADGVISDLSYMDLLPETLAPYEPLEAPNMDERFRAGSYADGWTAHVVYITPTTIAWRTDRVSDEQAPRSIEALVADPETWRGRVGTTSLLERFIDALLEGYGEDQGMALVEGLAALEPRLYPSTAALFQALGAGEIDVTFNFNHDRPVMLMRDGAPVDYVLQEPLHGSGVTYSVFAGAPHPYAAALFMEVISDPEVAVAMDQAEDGLRFYGQTEGEFIMSLDDFPELLPFGPISEADFRELNRLAERLFIRRQ
jgi:iron(III) transport system substrate-binding protein